MKIDDLIDLFFQVGILKNVKRSGWILKGIEDAESIADHSFAVTFLVNTLSEETKLDRFKMVQMALIHDLAKSQLGDIIYEHGKKSLAPLKAKYQDERKAIKDVMKNLPNKKYYHALWDERVEQKTKEAKFVRAVEKLEMVIQALIYEEKGHKPRKNFDEFWENAEKYLKNTKLMPVFKALKKRRNKLK